MPFGFGFSVPRSAPLPLAAAVAGIFVDGTQGAWYDPSDFSTLYQDSAGTTPVTALEQSVGLIKDKSGRGNHAYQPTSTSRPVLSRRINLLTKTEDFADSYWTKTRSTISSDAIVAPDGYQTADKLVENTDNNLHRVEGAASVFASFSYTLTVYLKAAERTWAYVQLANYFVNSAAYINLSTGEVGTTSGSPNAQVSNVGNGWWRVSIVGTCNVTGSGVSVAYVYPAASNNGAVYTGDGTSGIYIWGASLVPADLASLPYQRVNTTTDYDSDASKFPTFLRTDGVDDWYQTNAIDFSSTDKMFVSAGVRKLSDAAVGVVTEFSASINSNNNSFALFAPASVASNVQFASKGTATQSSTVSSVTAPITNVLTGQADIALPSVSLRVNGVAATPNISSQGTGNYGNYPLYLFRRGGTTLPFNGWYFGSVIAGKTLTAAQISAVERYLAGKTKTVALA